MDFINEEESEKESDEENEKESDEDNEESNDNEEEEEKNDNSSNSGSQKNEINNYKPLNLQSSARNLNKLKSFTRKLKNLRDSDIRRKGIKSSTILLKHSSSIDSENINYPLDDLRPIPIITSSQKELIHIFMTEGELDFLLKKLFNKRYYAIREEQIKSHLRMFIPLYYEKLFKGKGCLQNRLAISLSKKMQNVKPNFSIAFEMDEKFKNNEIVKEQSSKYLLVKKDILKHLDINKEGIINFDPFSKIKFKQGDPTKKEPLPKWAVSLKQQFENRDTSDDDDDDEEEFNVKNYRKLSASMKSINLKESVQSLNKIKDNIKNEEEDEDNNEEEPFEYPYKKYIKKLFYPKLDDFRKDIIKDCFRNKNVFGKIDFEKFICLLEFFISLFSGIQVKYSIDELGFLNMDFYASESIYMNMAEIFHYQVQFQIRDVSCIHGAENKVKPSLIHLNTKQNYEYNLDKIEYFPPSTAFIQDLSNKFRRYTATDNYHLCNKCEKAFSAYQIENAPCNSSVFRFIDKTRLLIMTLSGIIDMNYLENRIKSSNDNDNQNKLVKATMILRNEELINEFKDVFIFNSYILPFSTKKNKKLNSIFRNIFGETVGYYYTWISHYLSWIIFPAILGLITEIVLSYIDKNHIYNYIYLIFITFILLWGFYYVKDWDNFQKFYNHIWGMDSFSAEITNLYDDNYSKVSYVTFLGIKIPKIDKVYSLLVNFISVVLVFFSSLFIMGINVGIFKAHNMNSILIKYINKICRYFGLPQDISKYTLPILIFIVREALSHFFYKFSETLANLERPTDKEEYEEIVTKKRLTLEFVNYYFNLYYIAFYKRAYNICENDDCFLELRKQL